MDLAVGSILTGKVTGITKFGAFVSLAPGKSGLVHISEIANSYVNDVHDFLTEGQEVTVKLIGIDQSGRINLSIKQAQPNQEPERRPAPRQFTPRPAPGQQRRPAAPAAPAQPPSFEDKLKRFMQDSDTKLAASRQYAEKRSRRRNDRRDYEDYD